MSQLDVARLQSALSSQANAAMERLEAFSSIASTNTYLMSQPPPANRHFRVAIADHQTSGRGRQFRRWMSAPGAGLYLSMSYSFAVQVPQLSSLTLAIGVGVIAALEDLGIRNVSLKWPNDIVANDGKLGGILTEVQAGKRNGVTVVTGVGMNLALPDDFDLGADSGWALRAVDLNSIADEAPDRETLAAALVRQLHDCFDRFESAGLADFLGQWQKYDWLRGREITVDMPGQRVAGVADGVDEDGTLLVKTATGVTRIVSGTIIVEQAARHEE